MGGWMDGSHMSIKRYVLHEHLCLYLSAYFFYKVNHVILYTYATGFRLFCRVQWQSRTMAARWCTLIVYVVQDETKFHQTITDI